MTISPIDTLRAIEPKPEATPLPANVRYYAKGWLALYVDDKKITHMKAYDAHLDPTKIHVNPNWRLLGHWPVKLVEGKGVVA